MPPKPSVSSTTAISMPKSPPKTRRSTRKRAQSSVDTTAEPPVKKVATGDGEGLEGKESEEKGKSKKRGKGIRPTVLKKRVPASEGKAGENIKNTGDHVHLTPTERTLKESSASIAPPAKPIQKGKAAVFSIPAKPLTHQRVSETIVKEGDSSDEDGDGDKEGEVEGEEEEEEEEEVEREIRKVRRWWLKEMIRIWEPSLRK
ncbi:hypothetical protein BYT27DRAFT_7260414, partial [Phlegmacium glaucopus]